MPCKQISIWEINEFMLPEASLRKLLTRKSKIKSPTRIQKSKFNIYIK